MIKPDPNIEQLVTHSVTETRDGINYTTHYVNRPVKPGDPLGGSYGTVIGGKQVTTDCIRYEYTRHEEGNEI